MAGGGPARHAVLGAAMGRWRRNCPKESRSSPLRSARLSRAVCRPAPYRSGGSPTSSSAPATIIPASPPGRGLRLGARLPADRRQGLESRWSAAIRVGDRGAGLSRGGCGCIRASSIMSSRCRRRWRRSGRRRWACAGDRVSVIANPPARYAADPAPPALPERRFVLGVGRLAPQKALGPADRALPPRSRDRDIAARHPGRRQACAHALEAQVAAAGDRRPRASAGPCADPQAGARRGRRLWR